MTGCDVEAGHQGCRAVKRAPKLWLLVKYRGAPVVRNRAELDAALAKPPRYIVIEGTEALRAYAATLAYRGGVEAAEMEAAHALAPPSYAPVPALGRFRNGAQPRAQPRRRRFAWRPDLAPVVAAVFGLLAALLLEWLSFAGRGRTPTQAPAQPRSGAVLAAATDPAATLGTRVALLLVPALAILAAAALAYVVWQAIGLGRAARISWRVDHRVQGRLVIARVRTPTA